MEEPRADNQFHVTGKGAQAEAGVLDDPKQQPGLTEVTLAETPCNASKGSRQVIEFHCTPAQ